MQRQSRPSPLVLFLSASALLSCAWFVAGDAANRKADDLDPGKPIDLVLDPEAEEFPVFHVRVPSRATAMRLWTTEATHDVELYVNFLDEPDPLSGYYDLLAPNTWMDEELLIDVSDSYSLEPGDWYVCVVPSLQLPQIDDGPVRCTLHCELIIPEPAPLQLGERHAVTLRREDGLRSAYRVELPDDLADDDWIIVEVVSPDADVDVVTGPAGAGRLLRRPYRTAQSGLPYERLLFEGSELMRGLELHVYSFPELEPVDVVRAEVHVARGRTGTLTPAPEIPAGPHAGPLGTALAATVAVFGPLASGSGVVISRDGWVLTNAHVVSGVDPTREARKGLAEVAIGFDVDPREGARPTVSAELVEYDEELDLALLKIVGTLDLAPLDAALELPAAAFAPEPGPAPGDQLWVLGYPMTGGSGSLVSITVTHGVHSGWSREAEGHVIKTDAGTHSGMSGGACVNSAGQLVGLPSASISDANMAGGMGFVIPLSLVPREWLARAGH